mmetsp:Transcript_13202/g.22208  ORF Transcript_13202/g.22208 Transcript_13202/m.22208 type:complete len:431 (-) Transcript_13202:31-1323(-)
MVKRRPLFILGGISPGITRTSVSSVYELCSQNGRVRRPRANHPSSSFWSTQDLLRRTFSPAKVQRQFLVTAEPSDLTEYAFWILEHAGFASSQRKASSFADVISQIARKVTGPVTQEEPTTATPIVTNSMSQEDYPINGQDALPFQYNSSPLTEFAAKPPLQLVCGVHMVPHPDKAYRGGEDAYFTSEDFNAAGVADGVGGWSNQGIDPGLFSRQLMVGAKEAIEEIGMRDAVRCLAWAYQKTYAQGSSTACLLILDGDERMLRGANLGDSGILVLRGTDVIYRSSEQQHYFNCPYQLGSESNDTANSAVRIAVAVQEGDLVIMATDGLWDNLYDHEVIKMCEEEATKDGDSDKPFTQALAEKLVLRAHQVARSTFRQSPFSVKARQAGYRFFGGKVDDVTVVCCSIVGADQLSPSSPPLEPLAVVDGGR